MSLTNLFRRALINTTYTVACRKNPLKDFSLFTLSELELVRRQEEKLREIISYAKKNSRFYSNRLQFLSDTVIESGAISELLGSIQYLDKSDLQLGDFNDIKVPHVNGISRETTGSTGKPVRVLVDRDTLSAQLRSRWIFFGWHGVNPGAPECRFWGRKETHLFRAQFKDFLLNRKNFNMENRNVDKFITELSCLQKFKSSYFYGYPSLILKAAEIFDDPQKRSPKPQVIITTAEMLSETQREYLSSAFECPVVQEYGCSEVDIIAFECPKGNYHLNNQRLYVEFSDTDDGLKEIIVTDLDNRCMPLLRYKIGDLVELVEGGCDCGLPFPVIKRVIGRTSDRLVPLSGGSFFHAVKFSYLVEKLCKQGLFVKQYRVDHLSPRKLLFKIDGDFNDFNKKSIVRFVNDELNCLFNDRILVEVIFSEINSDGKHLYYKKYF